MNKSHQVPNAMRVFFIGQTLIIKQMLSVSNFNFFGAFCRIYQNCKFLECNLNTWLNVIHFLQLLQKMFYFFLRLQFSQIKKVLEFWIRCSYVEVAGIISGNCVPMDSSFKSMDSDWRIRCAISNSKMRKSQKLDILSSTNINSTLLNSNFFC